MLPSNIDLKTILDNVLLNEVSNFNLLFNKYINNFPENFAYESKTAEEYLRIIISSSATNQENFYQRFLDKFKIAIVSQNSKIFEAKTSSRLLIGLGASSILENSISLHPIYGVPYIPGSSLKGAFRDYYIHFVILHKNDFKADDIDNLIEESELFDNDNLNEKIIHTKYKKVSNQLPFLKSIADKLKKAQRIFGHQEKEGEIIFYDAYPKEFPKLEIDIMTPHYRDYYGGSSSPGDWLTPMPIKFLAIKENNTFLFSIRKRKGDMDNEIFEHFQSMLRIHGVGAKTAVNYGYFEILDTNIMENISNKVQLQQNEEKLKSMTPLDREIFEIENRNGDPQNEAKNNEIYNTLDSRPREEKIKIAHALQSYWKKIGKWPGGSKKQKAKVAKIRNLIGE